MSLNRTTPHRTDTPPTTILLAPPASRLTRNCLPDRTPQPAQVHNQGKTPFRSTSPIQTETKIQLRFSETPANHHGSDQRSNKRRPPETTTRADPANQDSTMSRPSGTTMKERRCGNDVERRMPARQLPCADNDLWTTHDHAEHQPSHRNDHDHRTTAGLQMSTAQFLQNEQCRFLTSPKTSFTQDSVTSTRQAGQGPSLQSVKQDPSAKAGPARACHPEFDQRSSLSRTSCRSRRPHEGLADDPANQTSTIHQKPESAIPAKRR